MKHRSRVPFHYMNQEEESFRKRAAYTADEKRIQSLEELLGHLDVRYLALISTFETLKPLWRNKELEKQLIRQGKIWGSYVIGHALLDAGIVYCYALLKDGGESNPTLKTLVRPFLPKNRSKNAGLLQRLNCSFIESQIHLREHDSRLFPSTKTLSKSQRARIGETHGRKFWRLVDALADDWALLERTSQTFSTYRGKWIAHFELEYDQKKKLRAPRYAGNPQLYTTLSQAIRVVER